MTVNVVAAQAKTIRVNGREFAVTTQQVVDGTQYLLTGKRGAIYGTMRNANRPQFMFLIDARGFGIPSGYEGVWLTDATGVLEVVS